MSLEPHISDIHKRLERLESRLAEKLGGLDPAGRLRPRQQRAVDEIRAKATAVRSKLAKAEGPGWEGIKSELEADWESLNHTFERWIAHVDEGFKKRK